MKKKNKDTRVVERTTAIVAVIVSVLAITISVIQSERQAQFNRQTFELRQKSLSPLLRIDYDAFINDYDGANLINAGFGTAIIDSIAVFYKGDLVSHTGKSNNIFKDLRLKMVEDGALTMRDKGCYFDVFTFQNNTVIAQGETIQLFGINKNCSDTTFFISCHNFIDHVRISVTYKSLFDEFYSLAESNK